MNKTRIGLSLIVVLCNCLVAPYIVSAQIATPAEPLKTAPTKSPPLESHIDNFERVSNALWRGACPSDEAVEELASQGVKTIVNLRMEGESTTHEAEVARRLGIRYYNIPLGFANPPLEKISSFLNIVNDPENQPVFVHCRQGADRTGMLVGIYRISGQDWTFDRTYKEMRAHHFKPFLLSMKKTVQRFAKHELRYDSTGGVTVHVAGSKKGDKVAFSRVH